MLTMQSEIWHSNLRSIHWNPVERLVAATISNILSCGALPSIGTDAPTAPTHPLRNRYVATTSKSAREPESKTPRPVNPEFALTLSVALAAVAEGGAKSCFAETRIGTLEAGKLADFVVSFMNWEADNLLHAEVEETWFGGKLVTQKKKA